MTTLDKKNIIVGTTSQVAGRTTDPNGTIYLTTDGSVITDVTVNGTSVVNNGVAAVSVPTNNNELTNGAGYITDTDLATVATTGAYSDLSGTPTIPAAVSVSATGTSTNNVEYITIGSDEYHIAGGGGGGMTNPMTTAGDIIVGSTGGDPARLAKGTKNHVLRCGATSDDPVQWSDLYLHILTFWVKGNGGYLTFTLPVINSEDQNLTTHGSSVGKMATYSQKLGNILTENIPTDGTTTPKNIVIGRNGNTACRVYYRATYGFYAAQVSLTSDGRETITLGTPYNQGSDAFSCIDTMYPL